MTAATGTDYSVQDILAVGERANTMGRLVNQREGFSRADDRLPRRVMTAFETGTAGRHRNNKRIVRSGPRALLSVDGVECCNRGRPAQIV